MIGKVKDIIDWLFEQDKDKIFEIKEGIVELIRRIKEIPELELSELAFFDFNEEWKQAIKQAELKIELPSGEDNIVEMLRITDQMKDMYSIEIGHPFNFDMNIITCLFLVLSNEARYRNLKYLSDNEIFEKLSSIDHREANKIVTKYLEIKASASLK